MVSSHSGCCVYTGNHCTVLDGIKKTFSPVALPRLGWKPGLARHSKEQQVSYPISQCSTLPPREIWITANLYVLNPREKSTVGDRNGEDWAGRGGGGEERFSTRFTVYSISRAKVFVAWL